MDYVIKLITIGEAGDGKTTLLSHFCDQEKPHGYQPTIGVEFNVLYLERDEKNYKIQFWDTAGQECFAPIIRSYYKNIAGVFYVIDLTKQRSIDKIKYWLREFEKNTNCKAKMIVVGRNCDSKKRVITKEKIMEKFPNDVLYMELQATTKVPLYEMVYYILDEYDLDDHPGISNGATNKLKVKKRDTCSYVEQDGCCMVC